MNQEKPKGASTTYRSVKNQLTGFRNRRTLRRKGVSLDLLYSISGPVVYFVDSIETMGHTVQDVKWLNEKLGAEQLRVIGLDCVIPKSNIPEGVIVHTLSGKDLKTSSDAFQKLLRTLKEFSPVTAVLRVSQGDKPLKEIVTWLQPELRITFGDALQFPLKNVTLQDFQSELSDYF